VPGAGWPGSAPRRAGTPTLAGFVWSLARLAGAGLAALLWLNGRERRGEVKLD
jgi:hypothetical protein